MRTMIFYRSDFTDEFGDGGQWAALLGALGVDDGTKENGWNSVEEVEVAVELRRVRREQAEASDAG